MENSSFKKLKINGIKSSTFTANAKNIGRSMTYLVKDISNELLPEVGELHSQLLSVKMSAEEGVDSIKNPDFKVWTDVKETISNAKEQIKTGNIYNQGSLDGFDDYSFDDYSFDNNDSSPPVFNNIYNDKRQMFNNENSINQVGESILKSNKTNTIQTLTALNSINNNLAMMVEFNKTTMSTYVQESTKYFADSIEAMNGIVEAINPSKKREDYSLDAYSRITGSTLPDFSEYGKTIYSNLNEFLAETITMDIDTMKSMFGSSDDLMGGSSFKTNPIGESLKMFTKEVFLPKMFTESISNFRESLEGFSKSSILKFNEWSKEYDILEEASKGFSKDLFKGIFGKFLKVDTASKTSVELDNYEKGNVSFDGVTRKAIVEVIPGYLRQILRAVSDSQNDIIYDYKNGKFTDVDSVLSRIKSNERSSSTFNMIDYKFDFMENLSKNGIQFTNDQIEDLFFNIVKKGEQLPLYNNEKRKDYLSSFKGDDQNLATLLINYLESNEVSNKKRLGFADALFNSKKSRTDYWKNLENNQELMGISQAYAFDDIKFVERGRKRNKSVSKKQQSKESYYSFDKDNDASVISHFKTIAMRDKRKINPSELEREGISGNRIDDLLKEINKDSTSNNKFTSNKHVESAKNLRDKLFSKSDTIFNNLGKSLFNRGEQFLHDIIFGKSDKKEDGDDLDFRTRFNNLFDTMTKRLDEFFEDLKEKITDIFDPIKEKIKNSFSNIFNKVVGVKNDIGFYQDGFMSSVANKGINTFRKFRNKLTGKDVTLSDGTNTGYNAKNTVKNWSDKLKDKLFGENHTEFKGMSKLYSNAGILGSAFSSITKNLFKFQREFIGDEKDVENIKNKFKEKFPSIKLGSGMGMLAGFFLPGGPILNGLLGVGLGFVNKSEKLNDLIFGRSDQSMIKNISDKLKDKNINLKEIGSLGLLGSIIGGPYVGGLLGVGASLINRSSAFNDIIFGKDRTGNTLFENFRTMLKNNSKDGKGKINIPTIGTMASLGILGANLLPGGPVVGALTGLFAGSKFTAEVQAKLLKTLFGKGDAEKGEKRGLLRTIYDQVSYSVSLPFKKFFNKQKATLANFFEGKILNPLAKALPQIGLDMMLTAKEKFSGMFGGVADRISKGFKTFTDNFFIKALRKVLGGIFGGITGATKGLLRAPVAMIEKLGERSTNRNLKRGNTKAMDMYQNALEREQEFADNYRNRISDYKEKNAKLDAKRNGIEERLVKDRELYDKITNVNKQLKKAYKKGYRDEEQDYIDSLADKYKINDKNKVSLFKKAKLIGGSLIDGDNKNLSLSEKLKHGSLKVSHEKNKAKHSNDENILNYHKELNEFNIKRKTEIFKSILKENGIEQDDELIESIFKDGKGDINKYFKKVFGVETSDDHKSDDQIQEEIDAANENIELNTQLVRETNELIEVNNKNIETLTAHKSKLEEDIKVTQEAINATMELIEALNSKSERTKEEDEELNNANKKLESDQANLDSLISERKDTKNEIKSLKSENKVLEKDKKKLYRDTKKSEAAKEVLEKKLVDNGNGIRKNLVKFRKPRFTGRGEEEITPIAKEGSLDEYKLNKEKEARDEKFNSIASNVVGVKDAITQQFDWFKDMARKKSILGMLGKIALGGVKVLGFLSGKLFDFIKAKFPVIGTIADSITGFFKGNSFIKSITQGVSSIFGKNKSVVAKVEAKNAIVTSSNITDSMTNTIGDVIGGGNKKTPKVKKSLLKKVTGSKLGKKVAGSKIVTKGMSSLSKMSKFVKGSSMVTGLSSLLSFVGTFAAPALATAGPIIAGVAAVGVAVYGITKFLKSDFGQLILDKVKKIPEVLANGISNVITKITTGIKNVASKTFEIISKPFEYIFDKVTNIGSSIWESVKSVPSKITGLFKKDKEESTTPNVTTNGSGRRIRRTNIVPNRKITSGRGTEVKDKSLVGTVRSIADGLADAASINMGVIPEPYRNAIGRSTINPIKTTSSKNSLHSSSTNKSTPISVSRAGSVNTAKSLEDYKQNQKELQQERLQMMVVSSIDNLSNIVRVQHGQILDYNDSLDLKSFVWDVASPSMDITSRASESLITGEAWTNLNSIMNPKKTNDKNTDEFSYTEENYIAENPNNTNSFQYKFFKGISNALGMMQQNPAYKFINSILGNYVETAVNDNEKLSEDLQTAIENVDQVRKDATEVGLAMTEFGKSLFNDVTKFGANTTKILGNALSNTNIPFLNTITSGLGTGLNIASDSLAGMQMQESGSAFQTGSRMIETMGQSTTGKVMGVVGGATTVGAILLAVRKIVKSLDKLVLFTKDFLKDPRTTLSNRRKEKLDKKANRKKIKALKSGMSNEEAIEYVENWRAKKERTLGQKVVDGGKALGKGVLNTIGNVIKGAMKAVLLGKDFLTKMVGVGFNGMAKFFGKTWSFVKTGVGKVAEFTIDGVGKLNHIKNNLLKNMKDALSPVGKVLTDIKDKIVGLMDPVVKKIDEIKKFFKNDKDNSTNDNKNTTNRTVPKITLTNDDDSKSKDNKSGSFIQYEREDKDKPIGLPKTNKYTGKPIEVDYDNEKKKLLSMLNDSNEDARLSELQKKFDFENQEDKDYISMESSNVIDKISNRNKEINHLEESLKQTGRIYFGDDVKDTKSFITENAKRRKEYKEELKKLDLPKKSLKEKIIDTINKKRGLEATEGNVVFSRTFDDVSNNNVTLDSNGNRKSLLEKIKGKLPKKDNSVYEATEGNVVFSRTFDDVSNNNVTLDPNGNRKSLLEKIKEKFNKDKKTMKELMNTDTDSVIKLRKDYDNDVTKIVDKEIKDGNKRKSKSGKKSKNGLIAKGGNLLSGIGGEAGYIISSLLNGDSLVKILKEYGVDILQEKLMDGSLLDMAKGVGKKGLSALKGVKNAGLKNTAKSLITKGASMAATNGGVMGTIGNLAGSAMGSLGSLASSAAPMLSAAAPFLLPAAAVAGVGAFAAKGIKQVKRYKNYYTDANGNKIKLSEGQVYDSETGQIINESERELGITGKTVDAIIKVSNKAIESVKDFGAKAWDKTKEIGSNILDISKNAWSKTKEIGSSVLNFGKEGLKAYMNLTKKIYSGVWDGAKNIVSGIKEKISSFNIFKKDNENGKGGLTKFPYNGRGNNNNSQKSSFLNPLISFIKNIREDIRVVADAFRFTNGGLMSTQDENELKYKEKINATILGIGAGIDALVSIQKENVNMTSKATGIPTSTTTTNTSSPVKNTVSATTTSTSSKSSSSKSSSSTKSKFNLFKPSTWFGRGNGRGGNADDVYSIGNGRGTANGYNYFNQNDPRWSSYDLSANGDGDTIGTAGCGPTTMAMALSSMGKDINPISASRFASEGGYKVAGQGVDASYISDYANANGVNYQARYVDNYSTNDIDASLASGQPVIALGASGRGGRFTGRGTPYTPDGHYIMITGKDENGNYTVNDPLDARNNNKSFSPDELLGNTSSYWVDGNIDGSQIPDLSTLTGKGKDLTYGQLITGYAARFSGKVRFSKDKYSKDLLQNGDRANSAILFKRIFQDVKGYNIGSNNSNIFNSNLAEKNMIDTVKPADLIFLSGTDKANINTAYDTDNIAMYLESTKTKHRVLRFSDEGSKSKDARVVRVDNLNELGTIKGIRTFKGMDEVAKGKTYPEVPTLRRLSDSESTNAQKGIASTTKTETFTHPVPEHPKVTSPYGNRIHPVSGKNKMHTGVDFSSPGESDFGAPILASASGTVSFAGESGGYGWLTKIDHGNGYETRYAHLSKFIAKQGDTVSQGQKIAELGGKKGHPGAGTSTGSHLHFEVRKDGEHVNPMDYIGKVQIDALSGGSTSTTDGATQVEQQSSNPLEGILSATSNLITNTLFGKSYNGSSPTSDVSNGSGLLTGRGNQTSNDFLNGMVYYSQGDERWASKSYGSGTYKSSACGPTSMAMVMAQATGQPITPDEAGSWSVSNGYRVSGGTSHGFFPAYAKTLGFEMPSIWGDKDKITSLLEGQTPVILSGNGAPPFTKGGHFVVAVKKSGDKVLINDPVNRNRSIEYDYNTIIKQSKNAWASPKAIDGSIPSGGTTSTDGTAEAQQSSGNILESILGATSNLITNTIFGKKYQKYNMPTPTGTSGSSTLVGDISTLAGIPMGTKSLSDDVNKYKGEFDKAEKEFGVESELLQAISMQESGGNANAKGAAWGLMQIESGGTTKEFINFGKSRSDGPYTSNDRLVPSKAIPFAASRLSSDLKHYSGDYAKTIQAYNFSKYSLDKLIKQFPTDWMKYRKDVGKYNGTGKSKYGDPEYIEHVLRYYHGDILRGSNTASSVTNGSGRRNNRVIFNNNNITSGRGLSKPKVTERKVNSVSRQEISKLAGKGGETTSVKATVSKTPTVTKVNSSKTNTTNKVNTLSNTKIVRENMSKETLQLIELLTKIEENTRQTANNTTEVNVNMRTNNELLQTITEVASNLSHDNKNTTILSPNVDASNNELTIEDKGNITLNEQNPFLGMFGGGNNTGVDPMRRNIDIIAKGL